MGVSHITWHHRLYGHDFEEALGVGGGQGSLACCSPWGHKESNMSEPLNWLTVGSLCDRCFQTTKSKLGFAHQIHCSCHWDEKKRWIYEGDFFGDSHWDLLSKNGTGSSLVWRLFNKLLRKFNNMTYNIEYWIQYCSLEGLMLKLKLQYFGHMMRRADSFEKPLMLGKIEGRWRRGRQRMRWLVASLTRWTWVWVNSGSWWGTGRPGVLRFMGSPRVRHNWVAELNWTERYWMMGFCLASTWKIQGIKCFSQHLIQDLNKRCLHFQSSLEQKICECFPEWVVGYKGVMAGLVVF